jgi:hypothetical protein
MTFDPLIAPVDSIVLAGQKSPGIAEVIGAGSPRKFDVRKGYGLSGGFVIFRGNELAEFVVKIRLYTVEDWVAWHLWRPLVDKPPIGERARALDIQHPQLEDLKIRSVVVKDVDQGEQTDDGEWTFTIKFLEYRSPKLALAKPEGSAATPRDPVDSIIEDLASQFTALAGPPPPPPPPLPTP